MHMVNKQLHTEKYTIQRSKCCFSSGENRWKVCCLSCAARCPQLAIVCHRALLMLWVKGKPAASCIVLLYLSTQSALKPAFIFLNKIFTYSNLANMLTPWQTSLLVHWIFKIQNIHLNFLLNTQLPAVFLHRLMMCYLSFGQDRSLSVCGTSVLE